MIKQRKYGQRQTNKPFITQKPGYFQKASEFYQGGWHTLVRHKQLSEHFLQLYGSLLILLLHPYLLYGPNKQIGSMSMTQWMEEMPIQGADVAKAGSEEWKGRLVGVDKTLGGDLWTLNPAHFWTAWPRRLSQRGNCNAEEKLMGVKQDTPFRTREERGNEEQDEKRGGLWEAEW